MKKYHLPLLFFLICLLIINELIAAEIKFVSTKAGLHLRSSPDKSSSILTLIPFGKDVSIINNTKKDFPMDGRYGSWVNIKYENKTGWVFSGFLCDFKPDTIIKKAADFYRKKYSEDEFYSKFDNYTKFKDDQVSILTIIDNYIILEVPLTEMDNPDISTGNVIWKYDVALNQFSEVFNIGHQNKINLFFLDDDKFVDFIITYGCCSWVQADTFLGNVNGFTKISEIKDCDGRYFTKKIENCDKMTISCSEDSKENIYYRFNCKKRNFEIYAKGKILEDIGIISAVKPSEKTISVNVESDKKERSFTFFKNINIYGFTPDKNLLSDFVIGEKVEFEFEDLNGKFIILSITPQTSDSKKKFEQKLIDANYTFLNDVRNGNIEKVKKYIEEGGDINFKSDTNWTALMIASEEGITDIVKLLISKNADVNYQNIKGATSLMKAAYMGNIDIVKLLIDNKADITLKDRNGRTALSWARLGKQNDIILILENEEKKN